MSPRPRSARHYPLTILAGLALGVALAAVVERALPSRYEARALLAVEPTATEPGFVLEPQVVGGARFLDGLRRDLPPADADDDALRRRLRAVAAEFGLPLATERLAATVRDGGRSLELVAIGTTAARAEGLATGAAAQLLEERFERRLGVLDARLDGIAAAVAEIEARRTALERRLALADAADIAAARRQVDDLASAAAAATDRLAVLDERLERTRVAALEPLDLPWLLAQPRAGDLAEAVAARDGAAARLAEIDAVYGARHPLHQAARTELDEREAQLAEAADALVATADAERDLAAAETARLRAELAEAQAELAAREATVAERAALERDLQVDLARLAELAASRDALQRQRLAVLPDARMVASTEAAALSRTWLQAALYGGGAGLGLLVGLLLAARRARFRPSRFVTAAALANATGLPVLAAVPPLPRRIDRVPKSRAASAIERIWLQGEAAPVPMRTLAVAGADRTVDAGRLAAALAQAGRLQGYTVLLIDAGAPAVPQHRLWRAPGGDGVAEIWSGARAWTDLVVPLGDRGPWLIRRGNDRATALAPGAVEVLLQSAERRFDRVIVATAPLSDTEGLRVARACRSTLVAVRAGVTHRRAIETALDELRAVGGDPLGLVLMDAARRA